MAVKGNLSYPKDGYAGLLRDFYSGINGADTFEEVKEWHSEKWSATVNCSRGDVVEKAGFAQMHMVGGVIDEKPADLGFLETLAYPKNHTIPGLIIMTNMNHTEAMGKIIVFYSDLVIQDGQDHVEAKALFSTAVKGVCQKQGHTFEELLTCLRMINQSGCGIILNYGVFPGLTDHPAEMEALEKLFNTVDIGMFQPYNLPVDPEWYMDKLMMMSLSRKQVGMRIWWEHIGKDYPGMETGYLERNSSSF